jgi:hypothetical protein
MSARKTPRAALLVAAFLAALVLAGAACGDGDSAAEAPLIDPGDGGDYAPDLDSIEWVEGVDHPFLPFRPGACWVYESDDGSERIEVVVLEETRMVMGVAATVVRDTVTEDGEVTEDTFDWFAQDADGNVWYLGEESTEYEDGEPASTAGSWEAGVDGALPGIIMVAEPAAGRAYRQEYYPGEAEDLAEVLRLDGVESVPFGGFTDLLVTEEWNPLEPDAIEHKYYARGVGLVLEVAVSGGNGRVELITFDPGE